MKRLTVSSPAEAKEEEPSVFQVLIRSLGPFKRPTVNDDDDDDDDHTGLRFGMQKCGKEVLQYG